MLFNYSVEYNQLAIRVMPGLCSAFTFGMILSRFNDSSFYTVHNVKNSSAFAYVVEAPELGNVDYIDYNTYLLKMLLKLY